MFAFAPCPLFFRRLGLALFLPQLGLFVWGLPPFAAGIWFQTEPLLLALFISAMLAALWLMIGIYKGWLAQQAPHPIAICLALWVAWQLIALVFWPAPWQSWFGPPQMGEGVAWHVALLVLFMLACPLWQDGTCRRIILICGFIITAIECAFHLFDRYYYPEWRPQEWPDYLAFTAGYLWIAAAVQIERQRTRALFFLTLATLYFLCFSGNRSAMALMGSAMLAVLFTESGKMSRFFDPGRKWKIAMMAACLAPMLLVLASPMLGERRADRDDVSFESIVNAQNNPVNSRLLFNALSLTTLRHEPGRWVLGDGWDRFSDALFKYALMDGIYEYKNGVRAPNWEHVQKDAYHSHNQPMEALLSLGLPGLILWFALPLCALWYLPAQRFWVIAPMLVGLVALKYVWFELPQVIPYYVLALAALSSGPAPRSLAPVPAARLQMALLCIVAAMGWSAWQQGRAIDYGREFARAIKSGMAAPLSVEWLAEDVRRGGERFQVSAMMYAALARRATQDDPVLAQWYDRYTTVWYDDMLAVSDMLAGSPHAGSWQKWLDYWLRYNLFSNLSDPMFDNLRRAYAPSVEDTVLNLCRIAPHRDDVATMFLLSLDGYTDHDTGKQVEILQRILEIAPNHRGALWVLGGIFLAHPEYEAVGRQMRAQAAALGVERIYPVTDAELAPYR